VEEEVPGDVGGEANGQEQGPAPDAEDGRTPKEHGADELQAQVARWSAAVQPEQDIGDGRDAQAYTVYEPLTIWPYGSG